MTHAVVKVHGNRHPHPRARIERRGGEVGVLCRCDEFKAFDLYATAQTAMGHNLARNCACGLHVEIGRSRVGTWKIVRQVEGRVFESGDMPITRLA